MPLTLNLQSDGAVARLALILYGIAVLGACGVLSSKVRTIRRLLPSAVLWHMIVFLCVSLWVLPFYYATQGGGDCYGYHNDGLRLAEAIRTWHFGEMSFGLGSAAMAWIVGILYAPFGGDIYGMLFFCTALSLLSAIIFSRAFAKCSQTTSSSWYCACIIFMPSIGMWTSLLGKDCIVALGLSLAAYGVGSWLRNGYARGFLPLCCGLALMVIVRPHIALTVLITATAATIWPERGSRKVRRLGAALVLAGVAAALVPITMSFVGLHELTPKGAMERQLGVAAGNNVGGSAFGQADATGTNLAYIPLGIANLFLRPYPWEAHNPFSALAAIENILVVWLVARALLNARQVWSSLRASRYLLFCALTAAALLILLSPFPNAGLNSRERVQIMPFLLACLLPISAKRIVLRGSHQPRNHSPKRHLLYWGPSRSRAWGSP